MQECCVQRCPSCRMPSLPVWDLPLFLKQPLPCSAPTGAPAARASVSPKPGCYFQGIKELLSKKVSSEQAWCMLQEVDFTTGRNTWGTLSGMETVLATQAGTWHELPGRRGQATRLKIQPTLLHKFCLLPNPHLHQFIFKP